MTRFVRENSTLEIIFGNEKAVIFDVHPKGVFKTIENLRQIWARYESYEFSQIISIIQQNPKLSQVKPEALTKKLRTD